MNAAAIAGMSIETINQLANLIKGIQQKKQGEKIQRRLDAQGRPILEDTESFKEIEGLIRNEYLNPMMAGEAKMRERIAANNANQLRNIQNTAGSGIDALSALGVAQANMDNANNDLSVRSAQQQQNDLQALLGFLSSKDANQRQQFQTNVLQPYLDDAANAVALKQAGMTNRNNAVNNLANIVTAVGQNSDGTKKDGASAVMGKTTAGAATTQRATAERKPMVGADGKTDGSIDNATLLNVLDMIKKAMGKQSTTR